MKTIHLSKNKWGCFEFIKYALHGSGTYYYGSCKCTPKTYFRICVRFLKMEARIKCMQYNLSAFLYIRPKEAKNYSEAAHAEVLTNSTKKEGQPLSSSAGWLEAVRHCSLKMKEENPFAELIGRFTCLNPMNHVTRSQRSEKFSPNLHGQGLHDPRWSYAYKANDSTISSEW